MSDHRPTHPEHDARLTSALRERGQRVTSQRLVIHRLLAGMDRHVTADDVLREAGARLPGLALPTVYATLDLFVDLGLAKRLSLGGAALYDPRTDDHAHVRCTSCGSVEDLDVPLDPAPALDAARRAGYAPATTAVLVEAVCGSCRRRTGGGKPSA